MIGAFFIAGHVTNGNVDRTYNMGDINGSFVIKVITKIQKYKFKKYNVPSTICCVTYEIWCIQATITVWLNALSSKNVYQTSVVNYVEAPATLMNANNVYLPNFTHQTNLNHALTYCRGPWVHIFYILDFIWSTQSSLLCASLFHFSSASTVLCFFMSNCHQIRKLYANCNPSCCAVQTFHLLAFES